MLAIIWSEFEEDRKAHYNYDYDNGGTVVTATVIAIIFFFSYNVPQKTAAANDDNEAFF